MQRLITLTYIGFIAFIWVMGNAFVWPIIGDIWDANGFLGILAGFVCVIGNLAFIFAVVEEEL